MDNELRGTAVQMFKDLYLQPIRGKYGFCYYIKVPNGKGTYLDIKTTEKILADIPLKALSPDIILQRYKAIQRLKKVSNDDDFYDDNEGDYYDGVEAYHKKTQYKRKREYE
jgi:hypothetical protein